MKILISAAETSSDAHGAALLKAIRQQWKGEKPIEAFGIGGPKLQAEGLRTIIDARELLVMGFLEILGHLPRIFRALRSVSEAAKKDRPDVAVFIDYPDFHFRLAKRLKKIGIPIVYYIPPKVWVWRKGRIKFLKAYFKKILCVFPFEQEFYKDLDISATYVGNPLIDELPLELSRTQAREILGLHASDKVVVLMPGSRSAELKLHLELMLDVAWDVAENLRKSGVLAPDQSFKVLMPFPVMAPLDALKQRIQAWSNQRAQGLLDIRISQGNAPECQVAADAGLIKSGTSTLEAGMLKCPHVILYRTNGATAWIFKHLIRYRGPVGLVNLVAGWKQGQDYLVPEYLLEKAEKGVLAQELNALLTDSLKKEAQVKGFEALLLKMKIQAGGKGQGPSLCAASEIIQVAKNAKTVP